MRHGQLLAPQHFGVQRTYNAHTRHVKSILLVYRVNLVDRSAKEVKNPQDCCD
jgi:hypothetical protein